MIICIRMQWCGQQAAETDINYQITRGAIIGHSLHNLYRVNFIRSRIGHSFNIASVLRFNITSILKFNKARVLKFNKASVLKFNIASF